MNVFEKNVFVWMNYRIINKYDFMFIVWIEEIDILNISLIDNYNRLILWWKWRRRITSTTKIYDNRYYDLKWVVLSFRKVEILIIFSHADNKNKIRKSRIFSVDWMSVVDKLSRKLKFYIKFWYEKCSRHKKVRRRKRRFIRKSVRFWNWNKKNWNAKSWVFFFL